MDFSERRDAYVRTYVRTYVCTYIYHTAVLCLLLPALCLRFACFAGAKAVPPCECGPFRSHPVQSGPAGGT